MTQRGPGGYTRYMDGTDWLTLTVIALVCVAVATGVLLVRVFKARRLLLAAGIPLRSKALFWCAVIYTLSPVDLVPDPVYLDDIGFLLMALHSLHSAAVAIRRQPGGGTHREAVAEFGKTGRL